MGDLDVDPLSGRCELLELRELFFHVSAEAVSHFRVPADDNDLHVSLRKGLGRS
ncbi:hypothetical protein NKG05_21390 [Oerskovia sp. M15]